MSSQAHWYSKKTVPEEAADAIRQMVAGRDAGEVEFSGIRKKLLKADGHVFSRVFAENRKYLYRGEFTAPPSENDYTDSDNYITEDGFAGFSLTGSGWLVSLYSNYAEKGFARAVRGRVVKGAYKLVCIVSEKEADSGLVRMYEDIYGFRKYVRTVNDTKVMGEHYGSGFVERFLKENGTPYHIFMIGRDAAGKADGCQVFKDYFAAESFVERTVRRI